MNLRLSLSGEHLDADLGEVWGRFEGVGLLRSEFLQRYAGSYLTVPKMMDSITRYVEYVAESFAPRPVWYRATDLWTNEANPLTGIDQVWDEESPIIGKRGLRRALIIPEVFEAEIRALASVAVNHKNLHLLLSFVGDADEFSRATDLISRAQWPNRIGCMMEVPSAILDVDRLVSAGATNFLMGLNDLTCLLTGSERGSATYDKLHRSVWWCVDHLRERLDNKVEWGIAGSLPKAVLSMVESHEVPYVSVHYSELPDLLGIDKGRLRDADLVVETRTRTRDRAAEYASTHQSVRPLSGGAVPTKPTN
jgi:signal transduction protein with GAF and PtsI domain